MRKYKRRKAKIKTMDTILILMAAALILFTAVMIYLFICYQAVPDTLITCFFTAFGSEAGFMAVIQVSKVLKEDKHEDEDHQP